MSCHIPINQKPRNFHFAPIKILVLIIPVKNSARFSGRLPMLIFNHLSDYIFDKEIYCPEKYE